MLHSFVLAIGENLKSFESMIPIEFKDKIIFTGKQKHVESIINIFDIGVLCSCYGEGISNTIMEYMALGKPVIATDCGGNKEIVVHNVTGFLIEPKNPH